MSPLRDDLARVTEHEQRADVVLRYQRHGSGRDEQRIGEWVSECERSINIRHERTTSAVRRQTQDEVWGAVSRRWDASHYGAATLSHRYPLCVDEQHRIRCRHSQLVL